MILDDGGDATLRRAQGRRVREGRRGARPVDRRQRGVRDRPRAARARATPRTTVAGTAWPRACSGVTEETTTGVHRLYQMTESGLAAVPGDQRQRLGDQEQVRQPLRLPALARRRHLPRHRRDARGQGHRRLRLRRRRQGLRAVAARPGRPRDHHRDRPDLRAAGGDGGLRGHHARGRRRDRRPLRHHDRQHEHDHRRAHGADEAQRDRRQHRPLRQRDRHGRPREVRGHRADQHQAAGRRVEVPATADRRATRSSCWPRVAC